MTAEQFYEEAAQLLSLIQDNLLQIQFFTQALLILICAGYLYSVFWRRK